MELHINGETREFEGDEMVVEALLHQLDIPTTRGVAVAVNDEVVTRSRWTSTRVHDGDRIEIIRATQGG